MKRREFLSHAGSAAMVTALSPGLLSSCAAREKSPAAPAFNYTSVYGVQTLRIWSPLVREAVHLFALADSHLYEADERNAPYHPYSARMEGAYNEVAHYRTHRPITPAAAFRECMEVAAASPADAIVHLGFGHRVPANRERTLRLFPRLMCSVSDVRRTGSAAYDLCCAASGRSDAFVELGLNLYDYAAGCVILTEAGGRFTGWADGEDGIASGNILATNGAIHEELRDILLER